MKVLRSSIAVVSALAIVCTLRTDAAEHTSAGALQVSPEVQALLRAEMQQVSSGVQALTAALASGDWSALQAISERIRGSYILEKQLSPQQREELARLPQAFRDMDAAFHQRASRLQTAAAARDAEWSAHHIARLLESCVQCHSQFARSRFPGLIPSAEAHHHH